MLYIKHKLEHAQFSIDRNIDVALLSEADLTDKYNINIPAYAFYFKNYTDGKVNGGTGILIRSRIKHHFLSNWKKY